MITSRARTVLTVLTFVVAVAVLAGLLGSGIAAVGASTAATQPVTVPSSEPAPSQPTPSQPTPSQPTPSQPTPSQPADAVAGRATALSTLSTLRIAGRAADTGYDRDQFGPAWKDVDSNGCSTRNDMLRRDLTDITVDSDGCKVLTGTLDDPYTGTLLIADQPGEISDLIDIEHVVALKDAWLKGAQQLTAEQRLQFANDPIHLLSADAVSNMQKGNGDAATWLPPNKAFRCDYVTIQVNVKAKYGLWVTQAEHDAIVRVLATCTDAPAAAPAEAAPVPVSPEPAPAPDAAPDSAVSYQNCDAVRAAGKAPIRAGDPGYSGHLDRDGDGVGCE